MTLEDANDLVRVLVAKGDAISAMAWPVPWMVQQAERDKILRGNAF